MREVKTCTKCSNDKPLTEFHKKTKSKSGLDPWCKSCKSHYRRGYFLKNKEFEVRRSRQKAWAYQGIDLLYTDYLSECAARDDKCDICEKQTKVLHVDHDHVTGKIRGLLCGNCNKALGLFSDSVGNLLKAMGYLNAPPNFT